MSFRATLDATWPPAATREDAGLRLRDGAGGGKRVCAATLEAGETAAEDALARAEAAMRDMGQRPLFCLTPDQPAFDAQLAGRGYTLVDPTLHYTIPVTTLTGTPVPRVTAFAIWEPLAIMEEIWAKGGIGPDRLAVMHRVKAPKTALLGRIKDKPAGCAFVAVHGSAAMLHALEILPEFRRQGLARWMVIAAAHWAQSHGCAHLSLLVTRANDAANGLYRAMGFEQQNGYHYRQLEA